MRIAVYTAIFGPNGDFTHDENKDGQKLRLPETPIDKWHFISFLGGGNRIDARRFKMLPHKYLPEYDVSIWIDGKIIITDDIMQPVKEYLKEVNFIVLAHPGDHRHLSIYEEAERCIAFNKGDPIAIKRQIEAYKKEGCPEDREVVATGVLIRRHHDPDVIKFNEAWWAEIQKHSVRDQISFPYVAWKHNLKYKKIVSTHEYFRSLGVVGANWFKKIYGSGK